jgi:hypothetical protein
MHDNPCGYKLSNDADNLYVEAFGKKLRVIRGWESFNGLYWFAYDRWEDVYQTPTGETYIIEYKEGNGEKKQQPRSPDDRLVETVWFGLAQGQTWELGTFSEECFRELGPSVVWKIPRGNLPFSGIRQNGE